MKSFSILSTTISMLSYYQLLVSDSTKDFLSVTHLHTLSCIYLPVSSKSSQSLSQALIVIHSVPPLLDPILKLNCFVQGEVANQVFSVRIANNNLIGALRDIIKDENPESFHDIDAGSLVLYKISIPFSCFDESVIEVELEDKEALSPVDRLSKNFVVPPKDGNIHIIVHLPFTSEYLWAPSCRHRCTKLWSEVKPRPTNQPSKTYCRLVTTAREGPTPSVQAQSATYAELQNGTDPIYDGRYADGHLRDTLTLPAMFYHPAFAHFLDDINDPYLDIPSNKIEASRNFIITTSAIYHTEYACRDAFLPYCNKAVGSTFFTLSNCDRMQPEPNDVVPRSVTSLDESSVKLLADAILLALREDKNEIGKGGSDSSNQAVLSTIRFWVQRQVCWKFIVHHYIDKNLTRDVRKAVDLLHAANFVFRDLCLQNIMVCHNGKIKLVDFDWAGIHGQAKYPAQLNMETIQWPQGVGPQMVMLKEHDDKMLDQF